MATLLNAIRYLSAKSVYAPKVIDDYTKYRGNPSFDGIMWLPNFTKSLGYNVIAKSYFNYQGTGIGEDLNSQYQAGSAISQTNVVISNDNFLSNPVVFNYITNKFKSFVPASSSGFAYRLRKAAYDYTGRGEYSPFLVMEKIGDYNDIRNRYNDMAVVLTGVKAYIDVGESERSFYGTNTASGVGFNVFSVSSATGRSTYDATGKYIDGNDRNNSTANGYILINQSRFGYSTTNPNFNMVKDFVWFDVMTNAGADIIVFDSNSRDKTGQYPSGSSTIIAIIFKTSEDIKNLGNQNAIPFVIDNDELAKTGDPKDFPDYIPAGVPDNETGGGEGNGDNDNDKIDEAKNPELSPVSAGNNLYAMTQSELEQTFNFLWDGHNKDILGITVSEANIIDSLCNCFYLPFDILSHDSVHCSNSTVTAAGYGSDIMSMAINSGYNKRFNFGDLDINEYYGSYLDYSPFTTISIYLPYIGIKPLDVSKCMGKTINVTYAVDFSQGIVTAYISYYYDGNKQVFAEFSGQIGIPIKVTGKNTTAAENAVKDAAFAVGGFALAAISVLAAPATGGTSLIGTAGAVGAGINAIGQTVNAMTVQPDSVSVGNAGAENWLLSPQGCYVYIQRPRTATPENFKETNGWATRYTGTISEFTGYLECSTVINTVSATAEEKNQITNLLKQGVYI